MRGLDTNVLLRYLAGDDPAQSPIARDLIDLAEARDERFYLSTVLVCELCWTLRGQPYGLDREAIAGVVERIVGTRLFEIQDRDLVQRALADFRLGRADFADYLLSRSNAQAGCTDTVTFDRKLNGAPGFAVLDPSVATAGAQ